MLETEKVLLFNNLNKKEINLLKNFLIEKEYTKNEKIFIKDKVRDKIIIIKKGLVSINNEIYEEETVALFKENSTLGEMSLIHKEGKHEYNLEAVSNKVIVLELSVYNWHSIVKKNPEIKNKICGNIANIIEKRLHYANNKLASLYATSKIIEEYNTKNDIIKHALDIILKIIPCNKVIFTTFSKYTNKLCVHNNSEKDKCYDISNNDFLQKLIKDKKTIIINTKKELEEFKKIIIAKQSLMAIPLIIEEKIIGFIILADKENKHYFSENNKIILETISNQISPVLENIKTKEEKKAEADIKKVYIDPFSNY